MSSLSRDADEPSNGDITSPLAPAVAMSSDRKGLNCRDLMAPLCFDVLDMKASLRPVSNPSGTADGGSRTLRRSAIYQHPIDPASHSQGHRLLFLGHSSISPKRYRETCTVPYHQPTVAESCESRSESMPDSYLESVLTLAAGSSSTFC